jgi:hypothetical protein
MNKGYRVTFEDFEQLLNYAPYREQIAPLIRQWFGYEVRATGNVATLHDDKGNEVSIPAVHAAIQADPERQGRLYREAMTLWH